MLYGAQVAVRFEINTKQIQCRQNVKFLSVKPVDGRNQ